MTYWNVADMFCILILASIVAGAIAGYDFLREAKK